MIENKKASFNKITKIGIGSLLSLFGILFMSFGSALSNISILRFGIVIVAIGGWLISWS